MVANVTGKPVKNDDFFDREREIQKLWHHLNKDDLLLLAPRRVGKTSLMFRLLQQAPQKKIECSYLSVADAGDELDFVRELHDAILRIEPAKQRIEKLKEGPLGDLLRRVRKVGAVGFSVELTETKTLDWRKAGEDVVGALSSLEQNTLLLVDELPVFVLTLAKSDPAGTRAGEFLAWFRKLREAPGITERVRWLLAGSIGLDTVARRLRISKTLGDLYVYNNLGPFSKETALSFLEALAQSQLLPLSEEVKAHICTKLLWLLPYHLQLIFSELRDHAGDHQCEVTVEVVDQVFEKILTKRPYFDHWEERLHEELGQPDAGQATVVLNTVARDPHGAPLTALQAALSKDIRDPEQRDEKLLYLLDILRGDGYVMEGQDERIRFCSPLLRDYWARRISVRSPASGLGTHA